MENAKQCNPDLPTIWCFGRKSRLNPTALTTIKPLHSENEDSLFVRPFSNRAQMTSKCGKKKIVPIVCHWCSYHILTSSVIYYWTDARQHGIYMFYIINKQTTFSQAWLRKTNKTKPKKKKRKKREKKNNNNNRGKWFLTMTLSIRLS